MVAASDIPSSWSLAPGLLVVSEMFLCTLSLVVCISARPRVMRTAGEGHAWCNAACWTQPCLALIILSSALSSPWWPPKPSQPCGNGSAVGRARAGRGTEGLPGSSLLWGWSGRAEISALQVAKASSSLFPVLTGRGDVCHHWDVPLTGSPSPPAWPRVGEAPLKGSLGVQSDPLPVQVQQLCV